MAGDALLHEMVALKNRVTGITDIALATRDGLLITADTSDVAAESLVAMAASMLGLARQMAAGASRGPLQEVVIHGSGGYVATFAVGVSALLVVVGDAEMDTTELYRQSRLTVQKLTGLLLRRDREQR